MADDDLSNHQLFFDALREVAGEAEISALRLRLGGSTVHVPCARMGPSSPFVQALGLEVASAVIARLRVIGANGRTMGGFGVYIAQGEHGFQATTRAAVVDAVRNGMTVRDAARHVGVCNKTAHRAVREIVPSQAERVAASDAALIAAHAEHPTTARLAEHLGISIRQLHRRLKGARRRTALALEMCRPEAVAHDGRLSRAERSADFAPADVVAHAPGPTGPAMVARPPRSRRPRREDVDAQLIDAHAAGLSPPDIAERFGWTIDAVYRRYYRLRRKTGLSVAFDRRPYHEKLWGEHIESRQAQVEAGLRDGLSRRQVADRLGVSMSTVGNFRARLRAATGEAFVPPPRDHPHNRRGRENRHVIAEAYAPGATLHDLVTRTGLSEPVIRFHLARLRHDTGQPFKLTRGRQSQAAA